MLMIFGVKTDLFKVSEPGRKASWQQLGMYLGMYVPPQCEVIFETLVLPN